MICSWLTLINRIYWYYFIIEDDFLTRTKRFLKFQITSVLFVLSLVWNWEIHGTITWVMFLEFSKNKCVIKITTMALSFMYSIGLRDVYSVTHRCRLTLWLSGYCEWSEENMMALTLAWRMTLTDLSERTFTDSYTVSFYHTQKKRLVTVILICWTITRCICTIK